MQFVKNTLIGIIATLSLNGCTSAVSETKASEPASTKQLVQTQSAQTGGDFLFGPFNVLYGETSILTFNLPQTFKARYRFSATDNPSIEPFVYRMYGMTDGPTDENYRFVSGSVVLYDLDYAILREGHKPTDNEAEGEGFWKIVNPKASSIPFETYTSYIPIHGTKPPRNDYEGVIIGTPTLIEIDEPAYFVITYDSRYAAYECTKLPARLSIDDKNIADENGVSHPIFPGNSVLTYGKRVRISPSGMKRPSCDTADVMDPRHYVQIKMAKKEDFEKAMLIDNTVSQ